MSEIWAYLATLLLPIAAASGWWMARRTGAARQPTPRQPAQYVAGFGYLLAGERDRALQAFLAALEAAPDTLETHFALGTLYRDRGELERATAIHENLLKRPDLPAEQRLQAELSLAEDYFRAGVLDRAEALYERLVGQHGQGTVSLREAALRRLLQIYEQEREWEKAIAICRQLRASSCTAPPSATLGGATGTPRNARIAQLYCEQAQAALEAGHLQRAGQQVTAALEWDHANPRAALLQANLYNLWQRPQAAQRTLDSLLEDQPWLAAQALPLLVHSYELRQAPDALQQRYLDLLANPGIGGPVIGTILDGLRQHGAIEKGMSTLARRFTGQAADAIGAEAVQTLAAYCARLPELSDGHGPLRQLLRHFDEDGYRCEACGFHGQRLHWRCPGCGAWQSMRPDWMISAGAQRNGPAHTPPA